MSLFGFYRLTVAVSQRLQFPRFPQFSHSQWTTDRPKMMVADGQTGGIFVYRKTAANNIENP